MKEFFSVLGWSILIIIGIIAYIDIVNPILYIISGVLFLGLVLYNIIIHFKDH
jgi:hypothetical protein